MKIIDNRDRPDTLTESSFLMIKLNNSSPELDDFIFGRVIHYEQDELQIVDLKTGKVFIDNFFSLEELQNALYVMCSFEIIDASNVTITLS